MREYDNLKELFGSQLPPILTSKKFIEFIKKYLQIEGAIPDADVRVESGNDIRVELVKDGKTNVFYVHYEPNKGPSHVVTVSPSWLEYGTPVNPGDISITGKIIKGTHDLKEVIWGDIQPPLNLDQVSLKGLTEVQINAANASAQDGNATQVAADGRYLDIGNKGSSLKASISRRKRYFWGVCTTKDPNDVIPLLHNATNFSSVVGSRPRELAFDPGYAGLMYRWFVFPDSETGNIQMLDSNSPCQSKEVFTLDIAPNPAFPAYTMKYRFMYATMAVDVKSVLTTE